MRLVLTADVSPAQRDGIEDALRRRGIAFTSADGALALASVPGEDDAVALVAMPGVVALEPAFTVREAISTWLLGATTVLGLLSIVAALLPTTVGAPADPGHKPESVHPSWPLLAWHAVAQGAPAWLPVALVFAAAAMVLFFWPDVARRFAVERPVLHAAIGVATLLVVGGLAALGSVR